MYTINDELRDDYEFVFTIRPKISSLIITWDLYWTMVEDGLVSEDDMAAANFELTSAAIKSIEKGTKVPWYKVSEKYALWGAWDTEPRAQFEWLWRKVYGEEN